MRKNNEAGGRKKRAGQGTEEKTEDIVTEDIGKEDMGKEDMGKEDIG